MTDRALIDQVATEIGPALLRTPMDTHEIARLAVEAVTRTATPARDGESESAVARLCARLSQLLGVDRFCCDTLDAGRQIAFAVEVAGQRPAVVRPIAAWRADPQREADRVFEMLEGMATADTNAAAARDDITMPMIEAGRAAAARNLASFRADLQRGAGYLCVPAVDSAFKPDSLFIEIYGAMSLAAANATRPRATEAG
jgi:hypothetical protein